MMTSNGQYLAIGSPIIRPVQPNKQIITRTDINLVEHHYS